MITVTSLTPQTANGAANALGRAFAQDPVIALFAPWDLPNRESRIIEAYEAFTHLADPKCADVALLDDQVAGAALWSHHPSSFVPPEADTWKSRLGQALGAQGREALEAFNAATHPYAPTEPHWHLEDIGASPDARGMGVGKALLTHRLNLIDTDPEPAFLESTTPNSEGLYARFGFETVARVEIGAATVRLMIRPPVSRN